MRLKEREEREGLCRHKKYDQNRFERWMDQCMDCCVEKNSVHTEESEPGDKSPGFLVIGTREPLEAVHGSFPLPLEYPEFTGNPREQLRIDAAARREMIHGGSLFFVLFSPPPLPSDVESRDDLGERNQLVPDYDAHGGHATPICGARGLMDLPNEWRKVGIRSKNMIIARGDGGRGSVVGGGIANKYSQLASRCSSTVIARPSCPNENHPHGDKAVTKSPQ
ncbi:hypothetical protein WN51_03865 [Melipona quadrifasciata]|uniref:Uncharacterized protein n=1 Tax=Melipona quadrifasciata TaxID=166423 RepID=A0A0M9AD38_9HYME|nr:hypothetical protein WN51_03865 [Melipona quadrifasciata]